MIECTYTFQRKSKYSGPLYIQELEEKIRNLQSENQNMSTALKGVFPDIDLESADLTETVRSHVLETEGKHSPHSQLPTETQHFSKTPESTSSVLNSQDELETMITASGLLNIDEEGHCQYHGDFAGLAFLQQIDERCSQLLGVNRPKQKPYSNTPIQQAFGSGISMYKSVTDHMIMFDLPTKETALHLTSYALRNALSLMNFIYEPAFKGLLERIFDTKPENYSAEELSFLPLLYVVLAIGELFSGSQGEAAPAGSLHQMKGSVKSPSVTFITDINQCKMVSSWPSSDRYCKLPESPLTPSSGWHHHLPSIISAHAFMLLLYLNSNLRVGTNGTSSFRCINTSQSNRTRNAPKSVLGPTNLGSLCDHLTGPTNYSRRRRY